MSTNVGKRSNNVQFFLARYVNKGSQKRLCTQSRVITRNGDGFPYTMEWDAFYIHQLGCRREWRNLNCRRIGARLERQALLSVRLHLFGRRRANLNCFRQPILLPLMEANSQVSNHFFFFFVRLSNYEWDHLFRRPTLLRFVYLRCLVRNDQGYWNLWASNQTRSVLQFGRPWGKNRSWMG